MHGNIHSRISAHHWKMMNLYGHFFYYDSQIIDI